MVKAELGNSDASDYGSVNAGLIGRDHTEQSSSPNTKPN
jgi:hypothetical protein